MEDKIRLLCTALLECGDPKQARAIAEQLQAAIHGHIEGLRKKLADASVEAKFFDTTWK